MSQATPQSVASGLSGTAFRNQMNAILAALYSGNSGATAPSPTVAGMSWLDTGVSPAVWRLRNAANTAWIAASPETVPALTVQGNSSGSAGAIGPTNMATLATMLGFSQSIGTSGRQTLPSGLILQWGQVTTSAAVDTAVTFPMVFPTALFSLVGQIVGNTANAFAVFTAKSETTAGFSCNSMSSGGRNAFATRWMAIGN